MNRWPSSSKTHTKNGNDIKPHRKNSNPMSNFNFVTMQQVSSFEHFLLPRNFNSKTKFTSHLGINHRYKSNKNNLIQMVVLAPNRKRPT